MVVSLKCRFFYSLSRVPLSLRNSQELLQNEKQEEEAGTLRAVEFWLEDLRA